MSDKNTDETPQNSPQPQKAKETAKSPAKSPRITNSQKEKDPRKVAAGKKLAAISKIAKSQKKYKAEAHNASETEKESTNIPVFYIGLTACVLAVLGVVYFKKQSLEPNPPQNPGFSRKSNLISLD